MTKQGSSHALASAARLHRIRQHLQDAHAVVPADAGIGDALTVDELVERLGEFLRTGHEVAFQHRADDRCISCGALADDFLKDCGHELVVFTAIPVARINHDRGH